MRSTPRLLKSTISTRTISSRPQPLRPFLVERHPGWDTAPYPLSCADCEPLSLHEILKLADPETEKLWNELSLGYTYQQGLPLLRDQIAKTEYCSNNCSPSSSDITIVAPAEGIWLAITAVLEFISDGSSVSASSSSRPPSTSPPHVIATAPAYQSLTEIARSYGCGISFWRPELESMGKSIWEYRDFD